MEQVRVGDIMSIKRWFIQKLDHNLCRPDLTGVWQLN